MTIFEFCVTYAVCWWLVLFMVLPHRADAPAQPGAGHAPSAPANPMIGKKMRWATLLAFVPAVALYFIVDAAHAETTYHAGGGCAPVNATMASDVNAQDGYSTKGKKVAPATMDNGNTVGAQDHYKIPLLIPSRNYTNQAKHNVDLSQSFIDQGDIDIGKGGSATLNGKSITPQNSVPAGCEQPNE